MQLVVSLAFGIPALFAMAVGGYHLAYGQLFPYLPGIAGNAYNLLLGATGMSFRATAILLLIFGGLAFFFAFLMYPRR